VGYAHHVGRALHSHSTDETTSSLSDFYDKKNHKKTTQF